MTESLQTKWVELRGGPEPVGGASKGRVVN